MNQRPLSKEYPEYFDRYVCLVPDGDLAKILSTQRTAVQELLNRVTEESAQKAYAPGKWTLKEVIGHMADTERVMAYRMFVIARNEKAQLHGMDQDQYVTAASFNELPWRQLREGLDTVRAATLSLISTIDDKAWEQTGTVTDHPMSARALAYTIAGHEFHHLKLIREKYLN